MSENNWNYFKIVPKGHNNCQLSIVNCQFGEAAKFQFVKTVHFQLAYGRQNDGKNGRAYRNWGKRFGNIPKKHVFFCNKMSKGTCNVRKSCV